MSTLKTSSPKSHPRFKYYMGTNEIEDFVSLSNTSTGRMEERRKQETEALLYLELLRNEVEDILLDEQGLGISAKVTRRFLEKLEAAADK